MTTTDYSFTPRKVNFGWINESFQLFLSDAGVWIFAILIVGFIAIAIALGLEAVFFALGIPINPRDPFHPWSSFPPGYYEMVGVSYVINWPFYGFFYGGMFKLANKSVRGIPLQLGDLFSGAPTMVQFMVYIFVIGVLSSLGCLALGVGCLIVTGLFLPANAMLADGVNFSDTIGRSFDAMKKDWFRAALFVLTIGAIYFLSVFTCCGIFVTLPILIFTSSLAYRDMVGMPSAGLGPQVAIIAPEGSWPPPPLANPTVLPPAAPQNPETLPQPPPEIRRLPADNEPEPEASDENPSI